MSNRTSARPTRQALLAAGLIALAGASTSATAQDKMTAMPWQQRQAAPARQSLTKPKQVTRQSKAASVARVTRPSGNAKKITIASDSSYVAQSQARELAKLEHARETERAPKADSRLAVRAAPGKVFAKSSAEIRAAQRVKKTSAQMREASAIGQSSATVRTAQPVRRMSKPALQNSRLTTAPVAAANASKSTRTRSTRKASKKKSTRRSR